MVLNFSTLVLFLPALHEITRSTARWRPEPWPSPSSMSSPCSRCSPRSSWSAVLGERAKPALDATHTFVTKHSRQIGIAIELVFAVYLAVQGFGELP